jgi:hypothetical protein
VPCPRFFFCLWVTTGLASYDVIHTAMAMTNQLVHLVAASACIGWGQESSGSNTSRTSDLRGAQSPTQSTAAAAKGSCSCVCKCTNCQVVLGIAAVTTSAGTGPLPCGLSVKGRGSTQQLIPPADLVPHAGFVIPRHKLLKSHCSECNTLPGLQHFKQ